MSLRALAVLALAFRGASARRATGRKHAPPSDGSVGALTSASLDAVLASGEPAFLILWPAGPCPTCDPLREFWRLLAFHHRGTAWQASCAREPIVCARLADIEPPALADEPRIEVWDGRALERYAGDKTVESLLGHLRGVLARGPHTPSAAVETVAAVDAAGDATAAAVPTQPIPRLIAPTRRQFDASHARRAVPAVIGGAMDGWPAMRDGGWSHARLRRECGRRTLNPPGCGPLSVGVPVVAARRGAAWADVALTPAPAVNATTIGAVLDAQDRGAPLYLFDQPLEIVCPPLLAATRAPRYFADDYLQQFGPAGFVRRARGHPCESPHAGVGPSLHPSLFVGRAGSKTSLHADSWGTAFWMAVLSGRKRFRLFNASAGDACLRPLRKSIDTYAQRFARDAFDDAALGSVAGGCVAWEGVVGPGDVIFIPAEWPHAVENLDDTLAISYNYVDAHSLPSFARFAAALVDAKRWEAAQAALDEVAPAMRMSEAGRAAAAPPAPFEVVRATVSLAALHAGLAPLARAEEDRDDDEDVPWDAFLRRNRAEHRPGHDDAAYRRALGEWLARPASWPPLERLPLDARAGVFN